MDDIALAETRGQRLAVVAVVRDKFDRGAFAFAAPFWLWYVHSDFIMPFTVSYSGYVHTAVGLDDKLSLLGRPTPNTCFCPSLVGAAPATASQRLRHRFLLVSCPMRTSLSVRPSAAERPVGYRSEQRVCRTGPFITETRRTKPTSSTSTTRRTSVALAASNVDDMNYGNAFLHDFCLGIPYGLCLALLGCIALATPGALKYGCFVAGSGVAQMVMSSKSLSSWKEGRSHKVWTAACLALCVGLTWVSASLYRLGAFPLVSGTTAALSGFMCAFLGSNVLLGGNKAPKSKES